MSNDELVTGRKLQPELSLILHKDHNGKFKLWACRGVGKGCARNKYRTSKAPCGDCKGPLREDLTIGEVQSMLNKGDA